MRKQVVIKILIDEDKDEVGNRIDFKGFDNRKKIQNTIELVGLLDLIKEQEISRLTNQESKGKRE